MTDSLATGHYVVNLLREMDGSVRCVQDHHILGLFPRARWLRLLEQAEFQAMHQSWTHSEASELPLFVGRKAE